MNSRNTITDQTGTLQDRYSYDAFGKRRNADSWLADNPTSLERRGYTGHEHLDDVGLIHMNGRVYDPNIGRMLSVDPIVVDPGNQQNWNRYSYVLNNPFKYTDPSGFGQAGMNCTWSEGEMHCTYNSGGGGGITSSLFSLPVNYSGGLGGGGGGSGSLGSFISQYVAAWSNALNYGYEIKGWILYVFKADGTVASVNVIGGESEEIDLGQGQCGVNMSCVGAELINPTSGVIRNDKAGKGHFGARRDNGTRKHAGIDLVSIDGRNVVAPFDGTAVNFTGATTGYPIVDITPSDPGLGIDKVRILYVNAPRGTQAWSSYEVTAGQTIGTAANLQSLGYSNSVTSHVHVQVQVGGIWVDPSPLFFGD